MTLILSAFVAGILTVAAPCVLPLLPVVLGSGLVATDEPKRWTSLRRPLLITASLAGSVVLFTLLLKATTALLGVPVAVWQTISGAIIMAFGLQLIFPALWEQLSQRFQLSATTGRWLAPTNREVTWRGDVLLGAALGPVFNSCSPTYAFLVAAILPVSFGQGLTALIAYAVGLAGTLLAITLLGQRILSPLRIMSNPEGWFRRGLGILLVLTGLAVTFEVDKQVQAFVLDRGWYDPVAGLEERLLGRVR